MYGQLLIHFVKRIVEEEVFFRTPGSRLVCAALVRRVFGVFTARKDKSLSIFDVMVGGADVCYIMRYRKYRTHLARPGAAARRRALSLSPPPRPNRYSFYFFSFDHIL